MIKALDSLTNEELLNADIHVFFPLIEPADVTPSHTVDSAGPNAHQIYFNFKQDRSNRPFDPTLGNQMLAAMGFPNRTVSASGP